MRGIGVMMVVALVGCGPAKTRLAEMKAPSSAKAAPAIGAKCVDGTALIYQRPLDGTTELEVVLRCEDDRVTVTAAAVDYPVLRLRPAGEASEEDEGELVEGDDPRLVAPMETARFGKLVKLMQKRIEAGDCAPLRRGNKWAVGLGNDKFRIMCDGRALWDATTSLERAVRATFDEVDPRKALPELESDDVEPGHEAWPFHGEYWRDELGYYRAKGG